MALDAAGKVCKFGFHATQLSGCATSPLSRRRRCRSLSTQPFAFALRCATRFGKQSGCGSDRVRGSNAGRLRVLSIDNRRRTTPFNLSTFLLNARCVIGNYTQVALGAFDFMSQAGGGNFPRHRFSFFATDRLIQNQYRIFETNEIPSCLPGQLLRGS
jgi:hypothetical protein